MRSSRNCNADPEETIARILRLLFVKLRLPFGCRLLAVGSQMGLSETRQLGAHPATCSGRQDAVPATLRLSLCGAQPCNASIVHFPPNSLDLLFADLSRTAAFGFASCWCFESLLHFPLDLMGKHVVGLTYGTVRDNPFSALIFELTPP